MKEPKATIKRPVQLIHPNIDELSAQAIYFLNVLIAHPKGTTITPVSNVGDGLILVDGGLLRIINLEQLDEDLAILVDRGFLHKHSSNNTIQFSITIYGIAYINQYGVRTK